MLSLLIKGVVAVFVECDAVLVAVAFGKNFYFGVVQTWAMREEEFGKWTMFEIAVLDGTDHA